MRRALVVLLALAFAGSAAAAGPFPGTRTAKDRAAWRAILHSALAFRIYTDPGTGKPTATRTQSILGVVTFAAGRLRDERRGPRRRRPDPRDLLVTAAGLRADCAHPVGV